MLPANDTIRVVWLDLDLSARAVDELYLVLSTDEQQRIAAFSTPLQQRRAIVRVARRRQMVAEFCDVAPCDVVMGSSSGGKPVVLSPTGPRIEVSSSHSGDVGLIAVSQGRQIGVDVEDATELPDSDQFASWVATAVEERHISALPRPVRPEAWLRLWTRKEAYLKATGQGIGGGITHIEVPLAPDAWGKPFRPIVAGPWWLLYGLSCPRPGLAAALVSSDQGGGDRKPGINVDRR